MKENAQPKHKKPNNKNFLEKVSRDIVNIYHPKTPPQKKYLERFEALENSNIYTVLEI